MKIFNIRHLFLILLGNTIYTLGVAAFLLPNGLITGGTTGLGIAMEHYFGVDISMFVLFFNVFMFLLGFFVLGKKFALTTLVSTFYYPLILGVFERIPELQNITTDKMLATICTGVMVGVGIGVVIRAGASTGGMDIPPLVLNKKFGIPVSVSLYVFDFSILLIQMLFTSKEDCIYGILLVLIYTVVLDKTLFVGTKKTEVKIVSDHYEDITEMIQTKLDRGVTLLCAQTGYLKKDQKMVVTVISNRELAILKQEIEQIDPQAFIIVGFVNEVRGRGFSLEKEYRRS